MQNVRVRAMAAAAFVAGGAMATLEATSCVHEPSLEELAQEQIVITQFAPGTSFGSYRTFAIADSISVAKEQPGDAAVTITEVDSALAKETLDVIANELVSRGYQRVTRDAQPDLGVSVLAVVRQNAVVPYGAWWGFGSASGAFWGYSGASFSTGITTSGLALWTSGALVIELYDLRAPRGTTTPSPAVPPATRPLAVAPDAGATTIPVIWAAFIYGVIGGGLGATLQEPPVASIQQAFAQSPYLKTP